MKARWIGIVGVSLAPAALGIGACAMEQSMDEGYYSGAGAYTSSGTGSSSSGAGGITNPPPVAPQPDAGSDAEPTCEGLDQSQPLVLYLSADDSNSMSSAVHAREALNLGMAPISIRTYEFLNYYPIHYEAPPLGQLSIIPQLQAGSETGTYDLQIGVRSYDAPEPRRPMTITFVADTSGSMGGASIDRERAVILAVAQSLAEGDIVNMVTWSTTNAEILSGHVVSGPNDPQLVAAANALQAGGGTDLNGGLTAGYALANQHYGEARLNRLLLISDGGANTGITDENIIAENSEDGDQEGIYLVGVGTGPVSGYNDLLMDTVTDKGRGAYVYIDSLDEAYHMFVDRFDETMEIAARGVQVELTLPWYFEMHKFYGEEYSENPEEVEPQHLAPSDAMIFAQVIRACDPAVVDLQDTVSVHAGWETPLTYIPQETSVTFTLEELLNGSHEQLSKGKAIVAYAEALKTGSASDLASALEAVQSANDGTDPELTEIALLIQKHPSYSP